MQCLQRFYLSWNGHGNTWCPEVHALGLFHGIFQKDLTVKQKSLSRNACFMCSVNSNQSLLSPRLCTSACIVNSLGYYAV